jgi:hypothetical protein
MLIVVSEIAPFGYMSTFPPLKMMKKRLSLRNDTERKFSSVLVHKSHPSPQMNLLTRDETI